MSNYKHKLLYNGIQINFHKEVVATWRNHKQKLFDCNESFGVLIGSCLYGKKEFWIENVTTPYSGDVCSRYHFELRDSRHQAAVERAFLIAKGQVGYFGTWHTHPENHPMPSTIDIEDWIKCINRNMDRQLFFVIVGIEEVRLFVKRSQEFTPLTLNINMEDIQ